MTFLFLAIMRPLNTHMNMKRAIVLHAVLIVLVAVVGCTDDNASMAKLDRIDSLMQFDPEAAFDSLCQFDDIAGANKCVEMKYRMQCAKVKNTLNMEMPSDSSFDEVVDYYESHGSSNERMLSLYLLGCIYRDKSDILQATQCYQRALECVDTTDADCDYKMLYNVYEQLGDVYAQQHLYENALKALQLYSHYAMKASDTLAYIGGMDKSLSVYKCMGDYDKVISQTQQCATLYAENGKPRYAASVYPSMISVLLKMGQHDDAKHYMDIYEKESGLFDANGNINEGHAEYYEIKANYYMNIGKLDSAEMYYVALDTLGYSYAAAVGLFNIYTISHGMEHGMEHAARINAEAEKMIKENRAEALKQVSAMYNYSKLQKERNAYIQNTDYTENNCIKVVLYLSLLFVITIYLLIALYKRLSKKQHELEQLNGGYKKVKQELIDNRNEIRKLNQKNDSDISELRNEIEVLNSEMELYKEKHALVFHTEKNAMLDDNETYKVFKEMAVPKPSGIIKVKKEYWTDLLKMVHECFPLFYNDVVSFSGLTVLEVRLCVLMRLHFRNKEMETLLGVSSSGLSNLKKRVNMKLYDDTKAQTLSYNLENCIRMNR